MSDHDDGATVEADGGVVEDDIFTTEDVGEQYRDTVYDDLDYATLEEAPNTEE